MLDLLLLFRCFPEVGRGHFGPFLCHFHLLALAFHPSEWGLVSDSGTIACQSSFGDVTLSQDVKRILLRECGAARHPEPYGVRPLGGTRQMGGGLCAGWG
jgi:hypothetical protein